jgi:hypothetical protein
MKLNELNNKPTLNAKRALKEHFNTNLNVDGMGIYDTKRMLSKVKGLMSELKESSKNVPTEQNPSYMKLMFMEQALSHHYGELKTLPMYNPRIVLENEEVEKSQVVLAANEMIDEMQKMIESVSDMLVKELPAVVQGVSSEFGTSESEQFESQVTEALTSLQAALAQSKTGLRSALGVITGEGGGFGDEMGMGDEMGGMPAEEPAMGGEDLGMGDDEMGAEVPDVPEEPEEVPSLGRSTR